MGLFSNMFGQTKELTKLSNAVANVKKSSQDSPKNTVWGETLSICNWLNVLRQYASVVFQIVRCKIYPTVRQNLFKYFVCAAHNGLTTIVE